jgi:hypothetical protein
MDSGDSLRAVTGEANVTVLVTGYSLLVAPKYKRWLMYRDYWKPQMLVVTTAPPDSARNPVGYVSRVKSRALYEIN